MRPTVARLQQHAGIVVFLFEQDSVDTGTSWSNRTIEQNGIDNIEGVL